MIFFKKSWKVVKIKQKGDFLRDLFFCDWLISEKFAEFNFAIGS